VGFFKSMKDMKDMAHAAPGLMAQSTELAANAQAAAAAEQAAAAQVLAGMNFPTEPGTTNGGDLSPIAGVSMETYVAISRSFAEVGYDQSRGPELAARHGVGPAEWAEALDGWNARITAFPAVARRFNALYTGR
jgi:hypothetical protein